MVMSEAGRHEVRLSLRAVSNTLYVKGRETSKSVKIIFMHLFYFRRQKIIAEIGGIMKDQGEIADFCSVILPSAC